MRIDFQSIVPIYLQVAQAIENDIAAGSLAEGAAVYSQLTLARELGINPATAAKGINQLVQTGILVKQRGLSMTVAPGARERLLREKRESSFRELAARLKREADMLGLSREQLVAAIFKDGEAEV